MRLPFVLTVAIFTMPCLLEARELSALGGVPPSAAVVREVWTPQAGRPDFIVIEDVHVQPEAQGTIASLIVHAHYHWGVRQALIEGAFGEVGPPPFPIFSPKRGDRQPSELLRDGRLSGAELAAALISAKSKDHPSALHMRGMEDRLLYAENLTIHQSLTARREQLIKALVQARGISRAEKSWLARLLLLRLKPGDIERVRRMHWSPAARRLAGDSLTLALRFYRVADLRSGRFLERAMRSPRDGHPCLVVTGGFHTPALTRAFRRSGRSYWVVTPRISSGVPESVYQDRLHESATAMKPPIEGPAAAPMAVLRLRRS